MTYPEGRIAGDGGFSLKGMIFLSFFAHVVVLLLLVLSPSLPTPTVTFGPAYSVQLVSMPASLTTRKGQDASLKELMDIAPSSQPSIQKESISTLPVAPLAPVETKKTSIDNLDKVLETIKKNVQSAATKAPPPPTSAAPKGGERISPAAPPASAGGRQGDGELSAQMRNYYTLIWSRIKGAWSIPPGILPQANIVVVVHARILRDGVAVNVGLEKSSGNRYFDESALRTVKKASPFPHLPAGLKEESLEVGIRFHSSEFR